MDNAQEVNQPEFSIVYWSAHHAYTLDELSSLQRLVEAGWRTVDSVELGKAFCGATAARVSAEAGVTTGSFFHHFPNAEAFARSMVTELAASLSGTDLAELTTVSARETGSPAVDLLGMLRVNLKTIWEEFLEDDARLARFRCQIRLWSHHQVSLGTDGEKASVAEAVRESYLKSQQRSAQLWMPALEHSGLEIAEPFDIDTLLILANALFEGLTLRALVDPGSVPVSLLADAMVAIVSGATRPAGAKVELSDDSFKISEAKSGKSSPQARSGAQRRYETRTRIVTAATGMFSEGWENVSTSDVAQRANVSIQTVNNLFGSVRAVAAATFAHHARTMYQNALGRSKEDPHRGLHQALIDLTVRARTDPEAARALLAERVSAAVRRGPSIGEMDIRLEVPVSGALALWLGRMGLGGDRGITISTMLANFVLTSAIASPEDADEIARLALCLVPQTSDRHGRR